MISVCALALTFAPEKPLLFDVVLLNSPRINFDKTRGFVLEEEADFVAKMEHQLGKSRPIVYANIGYHTPWTMTQKGFNPVTWMVKHDRVTSCWSQFSSRGEGFLEFSGSNQERRGMLVMVSPGVKFEEQHIVAADGVTRASRPAFTSVFSLGSLMFRYSLGKSKPKELVVDIHFSPCSVTETWTRKPHKVNGVSITDPSKLLVCRSGDQPKATSNLVGFPEPNQTKVYRILQTSTACTATPVQIKP